MSLILKEFSEDQIETVSKKLLFSFSKWKDFCIINKSTNECVFGFVWQKLKLLSTMFFFCLFSRFPLNQKWNEKLMNYFFIKTCFNINWQFSSLDINNSITTFLFVTHCHSRWKVSNKIEFLTTSFNCS